MKLRQLHYIHEVVRRGLNVTAAAEALHTSQPGVSKQIRLLEEELGVDVFRRNGKHLDEVTPAGKRILEYTDKLLQEVGNIRNIAQEYRQADRGELAIATTHTQARYALPPVIRKFRDKYPKVRLHLHQGSPPWRRRTSTTTCPRRPSPRRRSSPATPPACWSTGARAPRRPTATCATCPTSWAPGTSSW